jgi:glutamate carboxypeptidase
MPDSHLPKKFLRLLKPRLPQMLATLRQFVTAESPSLEKAAADRCCGVIAEEWNRHGVRVERISLKHRGDLLRLTQAPHISRPSGQLLILGHYDTVYSTGTLAKMPFRLEGGKAYGPGTFDMKAGIVQALFALQALHQLLTRRSEANPRATSSKRRRAAAMPFSSSSLLSARAAC